MTRTPTQLDRDIQETLGLPTAVTKKWRTRISAYKKAVATMEDGYSETAFKAMVRARDALDKAINDAAAHVPYAAGKSPYLSPAIQALEAERKELVGSTWQQAQDKGREANYRRSREEIKRISEEERDVQRPYDWMRR